MKFFSSLMLKNFSSHLTWKLFWTPFHNWSPLFQWTWTRKTSCYKRVYHSALQAMKHGLREHWTLETARNREVSIIRNCPYWEVRLYYINFRHWNCFLLSVAMDVKDEHGLKKRQHKFIMVCAPCRNLPYRSIFTYKKRHLVMMPAQSWPKTVIS